MSLEKPPEREEWNDPETGEAMHRLHHYLEVQAEVFVEEVEWKPGGAMDAARIHLAQYSGTVPEAVNGAILKSDLEVHTVGGYKTVGVAAPERRGGSLPESLEVER
jgi:hypothetical protein